MNSDYINYSLIFIFVKGTIKICSSIKGYALEFYKNSFVYKNLSCFSKVLLIYLKESFLGRITEENLKVSPQIISSSRIALFYKKIIFRCFIYLHESKVYEFCVKLTEGLNGLTIKTLGMSLITIIVVNLLFSFFLGREIGVLGWFMHGLFISSGLTALTCGLTFQEAQKTSFFLKFIDNYCKILT